jgi:hypothetical protein|tara:strand:+ start:775 stop:960 length:186 start_codon:yes stop_codon:yes gene_type:complete
MTDITKYKNVSLPKETYNNITKLQSVMVPDAEISRTQVINILVKEKVRKLNGSLSSKKGKK